MHISERETSILLGATLMHWGVPFHFALKRKLIDHQQEMVDAASDKLIAARAAQQRSQYYEVQLSDSEIALLVDVVQNCIEECGDNPVELRLQLRTGERHEVEALVAHLQSSLPSADAGLRR